METEIILTEASLAVWAFLFKHLYLRYNSVYIGFMRKYSIIEKYENFLKN